MDFDAYQKHAARTGGTDLLPENRDKGMSCAGLGLTGEAGEVADIIKKVIHHRQPLDDAMAMKLQKELGDVLWYIAHACNVMGWSMDAVAEGNVAKLRARYPNGFTPEDSVAKRDELHPSRTCKHCGQSAERLGPIGMWQHCPEHEGGSLTHEWPA